MTCCYDDFSRYVWVISWNFKTADNILYNYKVMEVQIQSAINVPELSPYFYKPIFIQMASIIECALYDLFRRIDEHVHEKLPSLAEEIINELKNKNLKNKLTIYIDISRKHKLLGRGDDIYSDLKAISKIRNRVHIQNEKREQPIDDDRVWTLECVNECGRLLKEVYSYMVMTYPRKWHQEEKLNLPSFPEPWKELLG